jgi:hypothetical protein
MAEIYVLMPSCEVSAAAELVDRRSKSVMTDPFCSQLATWTRRGAACSHSLTV